jgi:type II secretory pathway pseudopilin PulG
VLWILLDLAIVLGAMGVLAALVLGLWRRVKALTAAVTAAGTSITTATDALEAAQAAGPLGSTSPPAADGRVTSSAELPRSGARPRPQA